MHCNPQLNVWQEAAAAQVANMKAAVGWGPPPSIFVAYGPDQILPGMGEESTELHYQAKRQQGMVSLFLRFVLCPGSSTLDQRVGDHVQTTAA